MKKFSLILATLAFGMSASAQYQACFMDMNALGFNSTAVTAGTVLCQDENGTLSLAFDDTMKKFTPSASPYTSLAVNGGEAFTIPAGCTGNTNGKSPLNLGVASMISEGCVYKLETTKTGYFIFLTKLNTNKNYYVMEGQNNLYAYSLGVALDPTKNDAGLNQLSYTLPEDAFGNVDMTSENASTYLDGEAPEFTKIKTPGAITGDGNVGEGSGFICIASYATEESPCTFYYWSQGSKMSNNGFIYVPTNEPTLEVIPQIEFTGKNATPVVFGSIITGVENVADEMMENAPVYNLFGQKVSKDTKGILIRNGKKFINR